MKHKHRLLYILTLILFMLFFTACGSTPTDPTSDSAQPATAVATTTLPPPEVKVIINGTAVPDPTLTRPAGQLFNSPEYGVHLSQWWHVDDVLPRDLEMVQEMDFGWVKQVFAWRDIEGNAKGEFDWYRPDRRPDPLRLHAPWGQIYAHILSHQNLSLINSRPRENLLNRLQLWLFLSFFFNNFLSECIKNFWNACDAMLRKIATVKIALAVASNLSATKVQYFPQKTVNLNQ